MLKGLLAALLAASGLMAQGQTILQDLGAATITQVGAESQMGQSFVATLTGTVTALGVRSQQAVPATLRIYNGAVGSGIPGAIGAPIYTQAGVNLTAAIGGALGPAGGFSNIPLTVPLPVTAGQTYTFILTANNPWSLMGILTNPYPSGTAVTAYAQVPFAALDLAFQVFEVAPPPPPPPAAIPVPTLGEWAMLALMGLMAAMAAKRLRVPAGKRPKRP
jgi:hypothetical protein